MYRIFVINPGSTSTKVGLYQNEKNLVTQNIHHSTSSLATYNSVMEQLDLRIRVVNNFIENKQIDLDTLDAIVARGGLLHPIPGGTFVIDHDILDDLRTCRFGTHASNLGALIAWHFSQMLNKPAYIVDPVVVDELDDVARITGHPLLKRKSVFHALNQKAVARDAAKKIGKSYSSANLIVAHLGGGISIGAHHRGRVIDVNNALDGDGPFSPERSGTLPAGDVVKLCFSGTFSERELMDCIRGRGGLVALLGTNDMKEIRRRIAENGDAKAEMLYKAMAYQIAKYIGSMAAVLHGHVDVIVLTGGITFDDNFVKLITDFISFIAPVIVLPGEQEMQALAAGAIRVLRGEEKVKRYKENLLSI
ncbi:butyrate kinase [candidate division KSB1 bacterium]|nr:butyrate kinase [candidate division KSB1 bacterium]RQW00488.1 MAG: butyrate kinase [candidate division KSB1 bacterium]